MTSRRAGDTLPAMVLNSTRFVAAAIALAWPFAALAQAPRGEPPRSSPPAQAEPAAPQIPRTNAQTLDDLFAQLKAADSVEKARDLEQRIQRIWLKSGSETIDLLMARAVQATNEKDYVLAVDLLNQVTILKPDYAEGWARRATVYFTLDDYSGALGDLRRALALEPRNFSAMMGLAVILNEFEQKKAAIAVFRKVLEIDPRLESAKKQLDELLKETAGQDI
ncbi:MAG: tetratricopeptide repeat protein [Bauldia sp.]